MIPYECGRDGAGPGSRDAACRVSIKAREEALGPQVSCLQPPISWNQKGAHHASGQTWDQAARQAQEDIRSRQRVFPYQVQVVPVCQGGGRARAEVRLLWTPPEEAPVPLAVDRAHRRRRQTQRDEL